MNFLKYSTTALLIMIISVTMAQSFEGIIEFKRTNYYDETNYIYYVSSTKVKIDELNKDGKVSGTMLVDLKTKEVLAVNHDRKLYMEIKSKPSVKDLSKSEIFKTSEKKEIMGHSCTKWTVSNPDYKSKAAYWVMDDANYFFFNPLLDALNRKDKIALYFMQIPENVGYFPILGEETGFDGKLRSKLETTKMVKKKLDPKVFDIPKGYQNFSNS